MMIINIGNNKMPIMTEKNKGQIILLMTVVLLTGDTHSWCFHKSFATPDPINQVNYSPDNALIVVAGGNNAYIYNAYSFEQIAVYATIPPKAVNTAKFSKDQKYIAVAGDQNTVNILNATTYKIMVNLPSGFNPVFQVDFSWDSTKLLICGKDKGLEIWSVPGWSKLFIISSLTNDISACRFAPNGDYAAGDISGGVHSFQSNNVKRFTVNPSGNKVTGIDFSPDSQYFIASTQSGKVIKYQPTVYGSIPLSFATEPTASLSVSYNKDQTFYVTGSTSELTNWYNGSASLFSIKIMSLIQPTDVINSVDFSYDSQSLAAGSDNKNVYIYKLDCSAECPVQQYPTGLTTCRLCSLDMKGCRQCNSSNYCLSCTGHFYLDSTSRTCKYCNQGVAACQTCSASNVCIACINTYYLSSPTKCSLCWASIRGCVSCSNSTVCVSCAPNTYYPSSNGSCISCQILNACLNCNSSTVCTYCKLGYFPSSTGSCENCSLNCNTCTSANNCTSCVTGYYQSNFTCLSCTSNCLTCNSTQCFQCKIGQFLSNGSCLVCTPPCSTCANASYCLSCLTYSFGPIAGICNLCNNSCSSCSSNSQCLSCNVGYYFLVANSSCNPCSQLTAFCKVCTNSSCMICSTGRYLSSGSCPSCLSALAGCLSCTSSTNCTVCQNDHYLNNGICTQCTFPCLTCNDTSKCLSCSFGYYLSYSTSSCLPCSCPTCSSSTTCLSCALGLYLLGGSCIVCNNSISNCLSCLNSSICTNCNVGYYLNIANTSCVACSLGCTRCSINSTFCSTCALGFYLSTNTCTQCPSSCSTCNSSIVCTQCIVGNYLSNNLCISCRNISQGCLHCSNSICYACQFRLGYYLNGSQCNSCSSAISNCALCSDASLCIGCKATYTLTSSSICALCSSFIPECQLCSNNSTCSLCSMGFYASGLCYACSTQCLICTSATVCQKCLINSLLLPNYTCVNCFSLIFGCQTCVASNSCSLCGTGFYLNLGNCVPCLASIIGCLQCSNSSLCLQCEQGFYLLANGSCRACNSLISGCLLCNSTASQCITCQSGYFLNTNSQCSLCSDSNCLSCSNSSSCSICKSGFYLTSGTCFLCSNLFNACIFCNSSQCYQCQTGYYLNTSLRCSACSISSCEICNSTQPTQCLNCNDQYYLSAGQCFSCASIPQCLSCSSSSNCLKCDIGYYLNAGQCMICSSLYANCHNCLATVCLQCKSGFILNSTGCSLCSTYLPGCSYCNSSTLCLNCMVGFYQNNSGCSSCTNIRGCLVCRNSQSCLYCDNSYYLQSGTCTLCNNTLSACIACVSNSLCIACAGDYTLTNFGCKKITGQSFYPYPQLKLTSQYMDSATLKHTLWAVTSQFKQSSIDLKTNANLSYYTTGGIKATLKIISFEWGLKSTSIIFYTNNPFDFSDNKYYNSISFFNKRLLPQSLSNLQLNAMFQLTMSSSAVSTVLPSASHGGGLYLNYNTNQPEFIASLQKLNSYYYWIFGLIVTLYMILYFAAKMVILPKRIDNGELIAHILFLKCPVLALYPIYAQLINYCYGFMIADLPWLNSYFSNRLSIPTQILPNPYRLFYVSLSLASTYLPALAVFLTLGIILLIIYKVYESQTASNFWLLIYNFFCPGLIIAGMGCLQGAIYNSISQFTFNSCFYILGIMILLLILVQSIYSTTCNRINMYKLRTFVKGVILSLLHFSPVYLFSLVVVSESVFLMLSLKLLQRNQPRLWLVTNILPSIALLLLVQLSHSLVSIYSASILVGLCLFLDLITMMRQFNIVKLYQQLQIKSIDINITNEQILHQFNSDGKFNIIIKQDSPLKAIKNFTLQQEHKQNDKNRLLYTKAQSGEFSKMPSPMRSDNSLDSNIHQ